MAVLAPKPAPGALALRVAAAKDKAKEHAKVHAENAQPDTFQAGPYVVTVLGVREALGTLIMDFAVTDKGKPVPTNGPHAVVKPSFRVPDGTVRDEVIQGIKVQVDNFKEDPKMALRELIKGALRGERLL